MAAGAVLRAGARLGANAELGPRTVLGEHATVGPDTTVASGCRIAAGASVGAWAELRANVRIGPGAVVRDSARLGKGSRVGAGAHVPHGAEIGDKVSLAPHVRAAPFDGGPPAGRPLHIGRQATIERDVVIGDGARIGSRSLTRAGAQIGRGAETGTTSTIGEDAVIGEGARVLSYSRAPGRIGRGRVVPDRTVVRRGETTWSADEPAADTARQTAAGPATARPGASPAHVPAGPGRPRPAVTAERSWVTFHGDEAGGSVQVFWNLAPAGFALQHRGDSWRAPQIAAAGAAAGRGWKRLRRARAVVREALGDRAPASASGIETGPLIEIRGGVRLTRLHLDGVPLAGGETLQWEPHDERWHLHGPDAARQRTGANDPLGLDAGADHAFDELAEAVAFVTDRMRRRLPGTASGT